MVSCRDLVQMEAVHRNQDHPMVAHHVQVQKEEVHRAQVRPMVAHCVQEVRRLGVYLIHKALHLEAYDALHHVLQYVLLHVLHAFRRA